MTALDPKLVQVRKRLLNDFSFYAPSALKIRTKAGEIAPLNGSTLDYSDWKALGDTAMDHNFALPDDGKLRRAASLRLRETQLQLDILTTQPALQVYTGDGLNTPFEPRSGICLEAQCFPDAPNQPNFPGITLEPGNTYRQRTIYQFKETAPA